MRTFLVAAALVGASFALANPVEAKSIWLKCGNQEINLDSERERFSLTHIGSVWQGPAMFSPSQIDFEFQYLVLPGGGGAKASYVIDRKSLNYTKKMLTRIVLGHYSDTGWEPQNNDNPEVGKCSIMKTPPTAGNQI